MAPHDVHEVSLREACDASRERLDDALRALSEAECDWNVARANLAMCLRNRAPEESELVYGNASCTCGAQLAHWPDALHDAWSCSSLLLGEAETVVGHDRPALFIASGVRTDRRMP